MKETALNISNLGYVTFVKSERAKYQRITIRPDKTITVTIPRRGSITEAKRFLESKSDWIQKQLQSLDRNSVQDDADIDIDFEKVQGDLFSRLEHFSNKYNLPFAKAAFRCQKTKWGSCSAKNNINLNINIAFLPQHLQDYILLHELVHTKIKNHSKLFWSELNKCTNGRARQQAKELRKYRMKIRI